MSFFDYTTEENIQRYLVRLDQVRIEYESRWGVSKLPTLCSAEMQTKWKSQCEKLKKAVDENRINDVIELVEGSIRAYSAMENQAVSLGHKMHDADMWDVAHPENGQVYRIVKNNYDAGISKKDGARVYTLVELARILDAYDNVNKVKDVFDGAEVKTIRNIDFNFVDGDNLPF